MAGFTGHFRESFTLRVPLDVARQHFADPAQHAAHYGELERFELLDANRVRFVLPEYNYGVTRFRGHYTCHYEASDDRTVRWHTVGADHSIEATGRAELTAIDDRTTRMVYDASLVLDIQVGRLLTKVIAPIVAQSVTREMRAFVQRMITAVEQRV